MPSRDRSDRKAGSEQAPAAGWIDLNPEKNGLKLFKQSKTNLHIQPMNSYEPAPEDAPQTNVHPAAVKKIWHAPVIQPLGVESTETVTFKWFTADQHIITADYGTPPS